MKQRRDSFMFSKLQKAQIALREAAIEWVNASKVPYSNADQEDKMFCKIDRKLMRAALKYAKEKNVQ